MIKKLCIMIMAGLGLPFFALAQMPEPYSWHSQSANSAGSMPCGGGDIGLNVWVEHGDLLFYVARSGAFDENNTMLKAGRFRLRVDGGLDSTHFEQTLHLAEGYMSIGDGRTSIRIFADVFSPVVHVSISNHSARKAELSYETWRHHNRHFRGLESQQCSYKFGAPSWLVTHSDTLKPSRSAIWFYHVNPETTVMDNTFEQQHLAMADSLLNPLSSLITGGTMQCPDFSFAGTSEGVYASTDYRAYHFRSVKPIGKTEIVIALGESQNGVNDFTAQVKEAAKTSTKKAAERSEKWWHSFWQRSFVSASGRGEQIARNYTLFRYMLGCNARGKWPTKFNGGLFTFDPVFVNLNMDFTPDFRRWGGGTFTAQNQRLVYWPMLKSGDEDMMRSQLDFYLRLLPTARLRSQTYWGHDGANYNEQIENFGLPNRDEYGRKRPDSFDRGVEYNAWLEYTWDTCLEFCMMALEANRYSGMDISRYIPMVEQCVTFFDEHYRQQALKLGRKALDGDGHIIIYPGSGLETFKMAYNPANTVAALHTTLSALVEYLSKSGADSASQAKYRAMLSRVPELPVRTIDGHRCLAPAAVWARINNRELPQLYPVFPWRMYGVGRDSDSLAVNTWRYDPYVKQFKGITSWEQANIFAACLGLTAEADSLEQLKMSDGPFRFPAFWGPGHDWTPDHNWGGSGMIGLQEMLLQECGDKILLFPAWPKDIDASFRLHLSGGRVVEAQLRSGKISSRIIKQTSGRSLSYR